MVKGLNKKPDNDTLLELYSLYKQATIGNINTAQPWTIQLEASAKWNAWKSKDKAMTKYIEEVNKLLLVDNK
jgi:diazepam-binding inhibitor (GABA receptor modulating acyl-CoA-binding protein)